MGRPAYKVTTSCHGSDVAGDTAAAMAAGYLAFKDMCGGKVTFEEKPVFLFRNRFFSRIH